MSLVKKIKKGLKWGFYSYFAFTQLFSIARFYEQRNLSPKRQLISDEYNVTLVTNKYFGEQDINFSDVEEILAREDFASLDKDIKIHYYPKYFFQKPFFEQVAGLILTDWSGSVNPITNNIEMTEDNYNTLTHEIKHIKGFEALENEEFKEKWLAISGVENYYSTSNAVKSRIKLLDELVDEERFSSTELYELGFASNYARTNIHEDIAEFGEYFENDVRILTGYVNGFEHKKMLEKAKLAAEYGIISQEDLDAVIFLGDNEIENFGYMYSVFNVDDVERSQRNLDNFAKEKPDNRNLSKMYCLQVNRYLHGFPELIGDVDDYNFKIASSQKKAVDVLGMGLAYAKTKKDFANVYLNIDYFEAYQLLDALPEESKENIEKLFASTDKYDSFSSFDNLSLNEVKNIVTNYYTKLSKNANMLRN